MATKKKSASSILGALAGAVTGGGSKINTGASSSTTKTSGSKSSGSKSSSGTNIGATSSTIKTGGGSKTPSYTDLSKYGQGAGGYQADINAAVKYGDYKLAAQLEQLRNQKIQNTGSNQQQTNLYSGWLDNTDYGTTGKNQMANGASWEDVLNTYNDRYNKAAGTVGLQKFANDEVQQQMWDYIMANMASQQVPEFNLEEYMQQQPTFDSQYQSQIDSMLNEILNREDFKYDASTDPLFQQYRDQYLREGDRAMRDTMAEAAAGAGGMNSYAITAAQQANDYYSSQINDKIPELYQLAYQMYLQDIDNKVQDLGILQDMDSTQYNRYRDTMSDWLNDLNFAYGKYRDDVSDYQWDKNFNYNSAINDRNYNYQVGRDTVADNQYAQEFNYNLGRDQVSDKNNAQSAAYNKAMTLMAQGVMPDAATLSAAGISATEASAYIASIKAAQTAKTIKTGDGNDDDIGSIGNDTATNDYWLGDGSTQSNKTSFSYDEDEGIFTWNGKNYNTAEALQKALNSANLTASEEAEIKRKMSLYGFDA